MTKKSLIGGLNVIGNHSISQTSSSYIVYGLSDTNSTSSEWPSKNKLFKFKNANHELAQEKRFIDEQIVKARSNQEKLLRNLDALRHELEKLEDEEQVDSDLEVILDFFIALG